MAVKIGNSYVSESAVAYAQGKIDENPFQKTKKHVWLVACLKKK